jgi:hypothetical protein
MLKIPFVVRHFDVCNLRGIKGNARMSSDSGHKLALNDGYISDDAAIAKSDNGMSRGSSSNELKLSRA